MPKYRVETDQGVFQVELDSEPSSPEELQSLVNEALSAQPAVRHEPPARGMSAAGTPLPRTIADLAKIPSAPIEQAAESERPPVVPAPTGERHPSGREWNDLERQVLGIPPKPQESFGAGFVKAIPKRLGEAYESLASAGEPGISIPRRIGRWGMGALQAVSTPTAPLEFAGGQAMRAVSPTGPGVIEQPYAPEGHPWRQVGLPPEQAAQAAQETGEFVGGMAGPLALLRQARRLGGVLPRRPPMTDLPPAGPKGPLALPEIPRPVMATDDPVQRTLQAAKEQQAGTALDFGEVGRRRMAALKEREASYRPETPETPGVPREGVAIPEVGPETAKAAATSQKFMDTVKEAGAYLKSKTGVWPPSDTAKGIPAAERLVSKVQHRAGLSDSIHADLVRETQDIYKGLDDKAIMRVNQALDTPGGAAGLSQVEQVAYQRARVMFDRLADSIGLETGQKITDYFPHLRELVSVSERKMVKGLPTYLTETTSPKIIKRWFEKERVLGQGATDMGLDPVLAYIRGASKRIAYGGGKHPRTGENITSILQDIESDMAKVPGSLADHFTQYVNDMTGVPRGGPAGISPAMANTIKSTQFARTIGLNPLSPVVNLMQQTLTFSEVNMKNFAAAYKDLLKLKNPKEVEKLQRAGIIDALGASEHDFLASQGRGLPGFAQRTASKTGKLFQATEKVNRAHAYYAGLREAADRGLVGDAAEQFAQDVVRKTQFLFGKEDLPPILRGPLSENPIVATGQTSMRQFKNFPIKYTLAIKNMVADDLKNLPKFLKAAGTGDLRGALETLPSKTTKFAGMTAALFGSDAITAGFDRSLMGDDRWWQTPGLIGYLGMSLGHQAGLGAIPVEDLRSVMFFLPGPAIAMFLDAASAGFSVATGKDIDLTTTAGDKHLLANMKTLPPMDPDKTANQITRSIPVAGVTLNRIRQGLVHYRAEEPTQVRRPQTLPQAFGLDPVSASAPIKREATTPSQAGEAIKTAVGFPSIRPAETSKLREQIANQAKIESDMARRIAELMIGGQEDEARRLMESSGVMVSPEALRAAMDRAVMEPALVQTLRSRKLHRGPAIEKYGALPGGYGAER